MSTPAFAKTPEPSYYAVIFSSLRTKNDNDYGRTAEKMLELAAQEPGFIAVESVRDDDGFGITVSYWITTEAIANWKANIEHQAVQKQGKQSWYEHCELKVAKVERAYAKDQ